MRLLLFYILFFLPSTLYSQSLFSDLFRDEDREQVLQDSIDVLLDDIYFFIEYIETLEEDQQQLQDLLEKERNNIKVRTVTETVTEIVRDTVRLTQSGTNTNTLYNIPFGITQNLQGSIYRVEGVTSFRWDYENNQPIDQYTKIKDFQLRLNTVTTIIPNGNNYLIETQPKTPNIIITDNENNLLTEDNYIRKVPTRFGIGLVGGFGFSYQGLTPYGGIGITYSFYDLNKLFIRSKD